MKSTTPWGRLRRPRDVVDEIEMSDVAADVAAFLAADTTDVLAADTTDVLSAAKGVGVGGYLCGGVIIPIILTGFGYGYSQSRSTGNSQCISRGDIK